MNSILLGIIIVLVWTVLYYGLWNPKRARIIRLVDKLPGPIYLPVIGFLIFTLRPRASIFPFIHFIVNRFKPLFRSWMGPYPHVHLIEAEHIEVVLNSIKHIDKGVTYDFLHPWLGTGLLTSTGLKWHSHRKMITPTFHFKILEEFMEVFVEESETLVNKLKTHLDGRSFDIYPYITRCALDIICETAMGIELHAQDDADTPYVKAVYDMSEITFSRMIRPWFYPDFIFNNIPPGRRFRECVQILHGFTERVIQERRSLLSETETKSFVINESSDEERFIGKKKRKAFLDLLLETEKSGDKITDEEIREEVDTFMFEGHDTTTAGINWTIFLLGNHPDIQDKVYEELEEIFQGSNRSATTQDLHNMKYLERVIKESLRLYPSVPFISRHLTEDVKIDKYTIPAGCIILLHIYHAHRNQKYFPNPNVFDPDNFLPEKVQKRHPYAYIPFSAGPRNCIGQKFAMMEEKTILSYILRNYKIISIHNEKNIPVLSELVLRPAKGIHVMLTSRKDSVITHKLVNKTVI